MMHHRKQNPLYEHYEDVLDLLRQYDVTISLGDSLRPGWPGSVHSQPHLWQCLVMREL